MKGTSIKSDYERFQSGLSELFTLVLICLLPPISIFCDLTLLGRRLLENSVTETFQELFLLFAIVTLWISARKHPESRGMLALMAGLFACMFIRENDSALDHIWHGFWFWPAMTVAVVVIVYVAVYCRESVTGPVLDLFDSKSFLYIAMGLVVILVLSRLFGSGRFVWNTFITGYYTHSVKTAIQEGLELFGYQLLANGSAMLARELNQSS
ncbi:MAG: hypothetical protein WD708_12950 [Kiritimatiellia bacterium]